MLKSSVRLLFVLFFILPLLISAGVVWGLETAEYRASSVQDLSEEEASIFLQENTGLENQESQGSSLKWLFLLFGLLIISILPIIFSLRRDPVDEIKIIVEED